MAEPAVGDAGARFGRAASYKEKTMKKFCALALAGALAFGSVGCTNMNKTQQGLLSGTAIGAAAGAGISAIAGGSGTIGALVGGGIGALAGGLYGHSESNK